MSRPLRTILAVSALAGALCSAREASAQVREMSGARFVHLDRALALRAAVPFEVLLLTAPLRIGARLIAALPRPLMPSWDRAASFFAIAALPRPATYLRGDPSVDEVILRLAHPAAPPTAHGLLDRVRASFGWVPSVVPHARWTDYGLSIDGLSLGLSGSF